MKGFRFVHTADLHLDSPFVGLEEIDESVASDLREATFRTFERIIDLCIDEDAAFLLVAGDIYDAGDRSLRAQLRFRDGLKRLSDEGITSFVVHGNHDPLNGWAATLEWPKLAHNFGGGDVTAVPVVIDGETIAHVYGVSYPTADVRSNLAKGFHRTDDGPFAIGLLHCNVGSDTGHAPYAPCTLEDLAESGMDYWALGHVHNHELLSHERPMVVYPGNPQGRNPRELGPRGCYVVDVDTQGHPTAEFVPVDTIRWLEESVSIDQMESEEELITAVEGACQRMREQADGRAAVGRIGVTGRGPLYRSLVRPGFVADLADQMRETEGGQDPFVWIERVDVDARPAIDLEKRRQGQDFVADFLDLLEDYRQDPGRLQSLQEHLEPLFRSQRARRLLEEPTNEELAEWLEEAQAICVDLLTSEDE